MDTQRNVNNHRIAKGDMDSEKSFSDLNVSSGSQLGVRRRKIRTRNMTKSSKTAKMNRSKGSLNFSFNSSRVRQTLRANNRQLAVTLEETRKLMNVVEKQNLELKRENQQLITKYNNLRHIAGFSEQDIDKELDARLQNRMNNVKDIVQKVSTELISTVESLAEILYICNTRNSIGEARTSMATRPLSTSSLLSRVSTSPNIISTSQSKECQQTETRVATVPESCLVVTEQNSPQEVQNHVPNDLSIIMEQSQFIDDHLLSADTFGRVLKGDRRSRSNRRAAMTDFSSLQEFQVPEENTDDVSKDIYKRTRLRSGSQASESEQMQAVESLPDTEICTEAQPAKKVTPTEDEIQGQTVENADIEVDIVKESRGNPHREEMSPCKSLPSPVKPNDPQEATPSDALEQIISQSTQRKKVNQKTIETSKRNKGNTKTVDISPIKLDDSPARHTEPPEPARRAHTAKSDRRGTITVQKANLPKDRRGTFEVIKPCSVVVDPLPGTPENSQKTRRGTFLVATPAVAPATGEDNQMSTKKRRYTYFVEPENEGILGQDDEVLVLADSDVDEVKRKSWSPKRSSCVATTDGDMTICEELDMELTATIDMSKVPVPSFIANSVHEATFLQEVEKPSKAGENPQQKKKPVAKKVCSKPSKSIKDNIAEEESSESEQDKEKGKNVFKAWMSKPGSITFTSGRKDLGSMAKEGGKSRSKQKSMLPKKPRSKSGRSKTRLIPDVSPKTVFDFAGTPRNAPPKEGPSVYDMSLNESVPATKQSYNEFKGKPAEAPSLSKPNLKMVKERFATEDHVEDMTESPHGIMLVIGNGKRTKPRSKKQVAYSGKLTETHLSSPVACAPERPNAMTPKRASLARTDAAGRTPPRRKSRIVSSSDSEACEASDVPGVDASAYEAPALVDDAPVIPESPQYVAPPASISHDASVVFEDNVKMMPAVAPTPSPLKRLMARKFNSTEEEIKALFESSLMTSPRGTSTSSQGKTKSSTSDVTAAKSFSQVSVTKNTDSTDKVAEVMKVKSSKQTKDADRGSKTNETAETKKTKEKPNTESQVKETACNGNSQQTDIRTSKSNEEISRKSREIGQEINRSSKEVQEKAEKVEGTTKTRTKVKVTKTKQKRQRDSSNSETVSIAKEPSANQESVLEQEPAPSPSKLTAPKSSTKEAGSKTKKSVVEERLSSASAVEENLIPAKSPSKSEANLPTKETAKGKKRTSAKESSTEECLSSAIEAEENLPSAASPSKSEAHLSAKEAAKGKKRTSAKESFTEESLSSAIEAEENLTPAASLSKSETSTKAAAKGKKGTSAKESAVEEKLSLATAAEENQIPKTSLSKSEEAPAKGKKRASTKRSVAKPSSQNSSPSRKRSQNVEEHVFALPEGSPPKRSRRAAAAVSYKEPTLNCKMRRGDDKGNTIFINNVEVKKLVSTAPDKGRTSMERRSSEGRAVLHDISND